MRTSHKISPAGSFPRHAPTSGVRPSHPKSCSSERAFPLLTRSESVVPGVPPVPLDNTSTPGSRPVINRLPAVVHGGPASPPLPLDRRRLQFVKITRISFSWSTHLGQNVLERGPTFPLLPPSVRDCVFASSLSTSFHSRPPGAADRVPSLPAAGRRRGHVGRSVQTRAAGWAGVFPPSESF